MRWLTRFADRTHPLLLPGLWVFAAIGAYWLSFSLAPGDSCCWANRTSMWGSALTFSLISGYVLAAFVYLYRSHRDAVRELAPLAKSVQAVNDALLDVPSKVALGATAFGIVFGLAQFAEVLLGDRYELVPLPDIPLIVGNTVLWTVVALLTVGRVHDALAMRRLGSELAVDLYNLEKLRPAGRAAVRDVLVIMGALALMPLQSLDAEFRWVNYQTGLIVGFISASLVFFLPLTGIRRAVRTAKAARIEELQGVIDELPRSDLATLETLVAHRDRIGHLPTWPVDLSILSRVGFYLVIPPLAWVGAALVETVVQGYLD
ncbi:MAG: hypothetical protein AAGE43_15895 [Pseudomonadota bacterium]